MSFFCKSNVFIFFTSFAFIGFSSCKGWKESEARKRGEGKENSTVGKIFESPDELFYFSLVKSLRRFKEVDRSPYVKKLTEEIIKIHNTVRTDPEQALKEYSDYLEKYCSSFNKSDSTYVYDEPDEPIERTVTIEGEKPILELKNELNNRIRANEKLSEVKFCKSLTFPAILQSIFSDAVRACFSEGNSFYIGELADPKANNIELFRMYLEHNHKKVDGMSDFAADCILQTNQRVNSLCYSSNISFFENLSLIKPSVIPISDNFEMGKWAKDTAAKIVWGLLIDDNVYNPKPPRGHRRTIQNGSQSHTYSATSGSEDPAHLKKIAIGLEWHYTTHMTTTILYSGEDAENKFDSNFSQKTEGILQNLRSIIPSNRVEYLDRLATEDGPLYAAAA